MAVDINEDGTFALYADRGQEAKGHWHLNTHPYFSTGIELDGNSFSNEYRLTRRGYGVLCLEVRPDHEYWCKDSK